MNWYYVEAGQQAGPVTEAEFQNLLSSGKINGSTLVWNESLTEWKPYSQIRAVSTQPPIPGGVACAECGTVVAPDNAVRFGDLWICAACKPTFIQKTREGVAAGTARTGTVRIDAVLARDYDVNIGQSFNQAKALYKANFGSLFGTTLLVFFILVVSGVIPFGVGFVAKLLLGGPLLGGLLFYYVRMLRGEVVGLDDAFIGFKANFKNLVLTYITKTILMLICMIPMFLLMGIGLATIVMGNRAGAGHVQPFNFTQIQTGGTLGIGLIAMALGVCGSIYLQIIWSYSLPLVADKKLGFWQAMELSRKVVSKHFWAMFGLFFVSWLLILSGIFGCGVGVLFTLPLGLVMIMTQYERLFGDLQSMGE